MEPKTLNKWSKWSFKLPPSLTEEELHLKSKYAELKAAKTLLFRFKTTGKCVSPVKVTTKSKPGSLKLKEINSKKSSDFKKALKSQSANNTKRSRSVCPIEDDTEPRSINIRGRDLTDNFLRSVFSKHGDIWKIRINEEKTCAVLTFKRPNSAKLAIKDNTICNIDGTKLNVSLPKRKNTSWCNTENSSSALSQILNKGRSVHLSYKGHLTIKDLEEFFQYVGRVTRMYLNETKRFGFVTFETEEQARRAMKEMNGEFCKDVRVLVSPQKFLGSDATKSNSSSIKEERQAISYSDVEI